MSNQKVSDNTIWVIFWALCALLSALLAVYSSFYSFIIGVACWILMFVFAGAAKAQWKK